jgi:predicted dehydrogenase
MVKKVGIIGAGNISPAYLKNAPLFPGYIKIKAVADLDGELAKSRAEEFGVEVMTVEEMLKDGEIEAIVNLTPPKVHALVTTSILEAGKHAYSEKPLAAVKEDAKKIVALAKQKGLRLGCAPDTVLGAGIQTCRKALDDGWIGRVMSGTANMMSGGPEKWHPNPDFFYKAGGGPMFDMGPYYMTALVTLLGPVSHIQAVTAKGRDQRIAGSADRAPQNLGKVIDVEVPTHYTGILEFENGAVITVVISFDIAAGSGHPNLELYGTAGTLRVPDPNTFGNEPTIKTSDNPGWTVLPYVNPYSDNTRILGLVDMLQAIEEKREHRCSAELAYHVLDVMFAFEEASKAGKRIKIESTCARPAPMKTGTNKGLI